MKNNPYTAGPFVSSVHFYGRRALLNDLISPHHKCICLIGGRRAGKTSVLRRIEEELTQISSKSTRQIPVYLNLQSGDDPDQLGNKLIEATRQNNTLFPWLAQPDSLTKTGSLSKGTCDVVQKLAERAGAKGFQLLLLWDEAEKLLQLPHSQLGRFRSILQDSNHLRLVMTGTQKLYALSSRNHDGTSPFLHGFNVQHLPMLTDSEANRLIRQANNPAERQVSVSDSLIRKICDITGNHPFFIQHLCYHLFDLEQGTLRDLEDDDLVLTFFLASTCASDYDSLNEEERQVLQQLSRDALDTTYSGLSQTVELPPISLAKCLTELKAIGLIHQTNQHYKIANHFMDLWLKEHLAQLALLSKSQALVNSPDEQTHHRHTNDLPPQRDTPPTAIPTGIGTYIDGNVYIHGDLVGRDQKDRSIQVGDISGSSGVAIGHSAQANVTQINGAKADEIAMAFAIIMQAVHAIPESLKKEDAREIVKKLEAEARKGEQADEKNVNEGLNSLVRIAPDVWAVTIDIFIHPVKGLSTVFQKIAKRAKDEKMQRGT